MEDHRANTGYTIVDFQRYTDGNMTALEQHAFEQKCMEDPFVAEAYEGYLLLIESNTNIETPILSLEEKLANRVQKKPNKLSAVWYYASAAILFLCVGIGLVAYFRTDPLKPVQTSVATAEKIPASVEETDNHAPDENNRKSSEVKEKSKSSTAKTRTSAPATDTLQLASIEIPQFESSQNERIVSVESQSARSVTPTPSFQQFGARRANEMTITGRVHHAEKAISGVIVTDAGYSVVSDKEGAFSLPGKPGDSLFILKAGFEPQRISIKNSDIGTLQLLPGTHALSDIIVAGYGQVSREDVSKQMRTASQSVAAQPKNGWPAYEKYLMESARTDTIGGLVEISCIVSETGTLSDFETKGTTGLFEAAIRIVSNGPAWLPASQNGVNYASSVHFSIHFKEK